MAAIWPDVIVEENDLDQNISTLRQQLGERRDHQRYIVTVGRRGYRFVAPVCEGFAPVWPPIDDPAGFARKLNTMRKYVASNSLKEGAVTRTFSASRDCRVASSWRVPAAVCQAG